MARSRIVLICGASRSGKTILASEITRETGWGRFSSDYLMVGLEKGAPQLGIQSMKGEDHNRPLLFPIWRSMMQAVIFSNESFIFEGGPYSVEQIRTVVSEMSNSIRVCFLGYGDVDVDKKLQEMHNSADGANDWQRAMGLSDAKVRRHIIAQKEWSSRMRESCERYQIPYVDTGQDFLNALKRAKAILMS